MRAPVQPSNEPLYDYTLMPTHMNNLFQVNELQDIELAEPFSFTQNCRTMKIAARPMVNPYVYGSMLFDLESDPQQEDPITDPEIEIRMMKLMVELMNGNDCPKEQFERLGLPADGNISDEHSDLKKQPAASEDRIGNTPIIWKNKGRIAFYSLMAYIPKPRRRQFILGVEEIVNSQTRFELDEDAVLKTLLELAPQEVRGIMIFLTTIIKKKTARSN